MANTSRSTFQLNRTKNYVAVHIQQGVPLVDADWNEMNDSIRHEVYDSFGLVFSNGVKPNSNDLKIEPAGDSLTLDINPGLAIVGGRLLRLWQPFRSTDLSTIPPNQTHIAYLDIWEREVNSTEDPDLIDPEIGEETCIRLKRDVEFKIASGNQIPPSDTDDGLEHFYFPLALLNRTDNNAPLQVIDIRPTLKVHAQSEQGIFDVKAFGARGDGKNDDTKAIQKAIDIASINGGAIYIPPGEYLITDTLRCIDSCQVKIFGHETNHHKASTKTSTTIIISNDWPTSADFPEGIPIFQITGANFRTAGGMIFEGFSIHGSADTQADPRGIGFHVLKGANSDDAKKFWGNLDWRDVCCRYLHIGIHFEDPNTGSENGFGWIHVNRCRTEGCTWGFRTDCTVNILTLRDSNFRQSPAEPSGDLYPRNGGGAHLRYGTQLVVDGCNFEGQPLGIYSGMRYATISNNYFESMDDASIVVIGTRQVDIRSNSIRDDGFNSDTNRPWGTHWCYIRDCEGVNYQNNRGTLLVGNFCRNIKSDRPVTFISKNTHKYEDINQRGYYISQPLFDDALSSQVTVTDSMVSNATVSSSSVHGPFGGSAQRITATASNGFVAHSQSWSDLVTGEWVGLRVWMRFSTENQGATAHYHEFRENGESEPISAGTMGPKPISMQDNLIGQWYALTYVHQVQPNETELLIDARYHIPVTNDSMDITGLQSFRTSHPFRIPKQ